MPDPFWPFEGWDRYQFMAFLGQGAMGQVFKVFDPSLDRPVALKVLNSLSATHRIRFLSEARAMAKVDHPHVAKVHEVGEADGRPYLTMQLLEGEALISLQEKLSLVEKVEVLRQACEGVEAVHRMGLLHRDLKPGNIVVERHAESGLHAYVLDFGLAFDSAEEERVPDQVMGTPAFMSPEQAAGDALDKRSDIFSLGTTLFAVLSGDSPFQGESLKSTLGKVAEHRPPSLHALDAAVPGDLAAIIQKAMEKDPDLRYPSARALGLDLGRWLRGDPVEAYGARPLYRVFKRLAKHRILAVLCALLSVAALGSGLFFLSSRHQAKLQTQYYFYFGQEAEQLEAALVMAEVLPLHDTVPERQAIVNRMQGLEKTMIERGPLAKAPGLYALGRGHLALNNLDQAREKLESAWELGLRTPEAAYALGSCLLKSYRLALDGTLGSARLEKKAELDKTMKPLIIRYLAQGKGASKMITATVAEAQLAWIEGRIPEALAKAEEAFKAQPWNYQALLLQAQIHFEAEAKTLSKEDFFPKAKALLEKAKGLARSCKDVYYFAASVAREEFTRISLTRPDNRAALEAFMTSLQALRQVHSQDGASYTQEASLWYEETFRIDENESRLAQLCQRMIALTDQALQFNPKDLDALNLKGLAYCRLAEGLMTQGLDPLEPLRQAQSIYESVGEELYSNHYYLGNLGLVHNIRGRYELASHRNPMVSLEKAIGLLKKADALKFQWYHHLNLAFTYQYMAMFHWKQAQDERPVLQSAMDEALMAAKGRGEPVRHLTSIRLSEVHLLKARLAALDGQPDPEALIQARHYLNEAESVKADARNVALLEAWISILESFSNRGSIELKRTEKSLDQSIKVDPGNPVLGCLRAWFYFERFRKAPSWRAYLALERHIAEQAKGPFYEIEVHFLAAEACRMALKSQLAGLTAEQWRERMHSQMEQASRQDPWIRPAVERWLAKAQGEALEKVQASKKDQLH